MTKEIIELSSPDPVIVADRTLRFTATEEVKDRSGDVVRVEGLRIEDYKKNPTFLFGHTDTALPVGKVIRLEKTEDKLIVDVEFDPDEFSELVFQKFKSGSLNAVSIGFDPVMEEIEEFEEGGLDFRKADLLEISAVPVGDNQNALVHRKSERNLEEMAFDLIVEKSMGGKGVDIDTSDSDDETDESKEIEFKVEKGARLGEFLRLLMQSELDEDEPMSSLIGEVAQESGRADSTIRSVVSGETQCPPTEVLDAFAQVLRVESDQLASIGARDGCDYDVSAFPGDDEEDEDNSSDKPEQNSAEDVEDKDKAGDGTEEAIAAFRKEIEELKSKLEDEPAQDETPDNEGVDPVDFYIDGDEREDSKIEFVLN